MTAWDELKPVIVRLRDQQPGALAGYPTPESSEGRTPPFKIRLAPWAADAAEELHRQFGDDVDLTVGFLPYPPGRQSQPRRAPGQRPDLLDPREVTAALDRVRPGDVLIVPGRQSDGPAVVSSGQTLRHHLTIHNQTSSELQIATNGQVTAAVVDPQTGEVVGGYSGAQTLPLKFFLADPGGSARIPLLIGTASRTPRLGYTVPAGEWGIQATLKLGPDPRNPSRRRTPILPLTITV